MREKRCGFRRNVVKASSNSGAPGVPGRPWRYAVARRCGEFSQRRLRASKWLVRKTDWRDANRAQREGPTV
jgi:hypothetical protein